MRKKGAVALGSLRVVAAVGLVIAAATARVIASGEGEIAESTKALKAGDPEGATVHARRAAGYYAPGAPHVRVAYERLIALAVTAEKMGDPAAAIFAWRAVRTASIETRWLVSPHQEDRERADAAIARLDAAATKPGLHADPPAKLAREELEALSRDEAPRTPWVITLVAGALAWALGAVWVGLRAIDASGSIDRKRALPGLTLFLVGASAWLLAIWRA